jgi:hypothetical protein
VLSSEQLVFFDRAISPLQPGELRRVYFQVLLTCLSEFGLHPLPLNRGAFFAVHFADRLDARPYSADCPFALKASAGHVTWWFRTPSLHLTPISGNMITSQFSDAKVRKDGVIVVELRSVADAERLLGLVRDALRQLPGNS